MFTPDEIRALEREADGEADEGTSAPEDCLHGTPGCACYQAGNALPPGETSRNVRRVR